MVSPADRFLDVNLSVVIIDDDRRRRRALDDAEFVGNVRYENNVVINNVIDITYVEERTRKNVRQVDVRRTASTQETPRAASARANSRPMPAVAPVTTAHCP